MRFTHYRLGHVAVGSVVEVTLRGSAANVRLMDQSNLNAYKAGRRHRRAADREAPAAVWPRVGRELLDGSRCGTPPKLRPLPCELGMCRPTNQYAAVITALTEGGGCRPPDGFDDRGSQCRRPSRTGQPLAGGGTAPPSRRHRYPL